MAAPNSKKNGQTPEDRHKMANKMIKTRKTKYLNISYEK
mgnify:CR=1 FL=1